MSNTIIIDETQKKTLATMASDPLDDKLAKRARIILGLADGKTTREIAAEVSLNKDAVTRWKNRFLDGGIEGLFSEHGGGAPSAIVVPDLRARIEALIGSKPAGTWTRKELADQLGVPEIRINNELSKMNITLSRSTSWTFATTDAIKSRCMCIAGMYLSASAKCIVICSSGKELVAGDESFTTRNRLLAEQLSGCGEELTLRDVLWTASDHAKDIWKKKPMSMQGFLEEVISTLPDEESLLCYAIGVSDEPIQYKGKKPINLTYQSVPDLAEWTAHVEGILKELSAPTDQAATMDILNAMKHFNNVCMPTTEPVIWKKTVCISSGVLPVTEVLQETVSHASEILPESSIQKPCYQSLEEAIASALGDPPEEDEKIEVFMIPVVRDKHSLHCSVVRSNEDFPNSDAFDLTSSDGFMHGFNQMEKPMILLRNNAGQEAAKLFVDVVKKKSMTAV